MSTSPGSSSTSRTSMAATGWLTSFPRSRDTAPRTPHRFRFAGRLPFAGRFQRRGGCLPIDDTLGFWIHQRATAVDGRQGPGEGRTEARSAGVRVQPDPAAVPLDDLLAHRQADAGPGELVLAVQTLEDHEDALAVLGLDADAVVAAAEQVLGRRAVVGALLLHGQAHGGRLFTAELDRIADEVLEQSGEERLL